VKTVVEMRKVDLWDFDLDMAWSSAFIVDDFAAVSRAEIFYFLKLAFLTICTIG
jgi:hypothetical protein